MQLYGFRNGEETIDTRLKRKQASFADARLISALEGDDDDILIAEYPWRQRGFVWYTDWDAQT
jgi:hypothetical protein